MKICMICKDIVHQPISGDSQHIYNLALRLSKNYDVVLIGNGGMIRETKVWNFVKSLKIIEVPDYPSLIGGGIAYFLFKQPLLDYFVSKFAKYNINLKKIFETEAKDADVIVSESCWYFPLINSLSFLNEKVLVYDARNVEYLLKDKIYTGIFRKELLPYIKKIEKGLIDKADIVFAVSEDEKKEFTKLYGANPEKIVVCPPAIEIPETIERSEVIPNTAVFMGSAYFANFEAVEYIINTLAKELPEVEFRIVGSVCSRFKGTHKNVKLHGFVSENKKKEILSTSAVGICPVFHGAGVNVKILEYFAYGLPVITTPAGARGFEEPERIMVIADKKDFANSLRNLLERKDMQRKLGAAGREYVRTKRSWENVENIWLTALKNPGNT
ncbi:MAG: glycosyltransferase family 4 protein [Thermoplasmata archaeon]